MTGATPQKSRIQPAHASAAPVPASAKNFRAGESAAFFSSAPVNTPLATVATKFSDGKIHA